MTHILLDYSAKSQFGYANQLKKFEIKRLADGFGLRLEFKREEDVSYEFVLNSAIDKKTLPSVSGLQVAYDFNWDDILALSEDRGLAALRAERGFVRFRFDQIIATTLVERRSIQTTFPLGCPLVTVATPYKGCSIDEADIIVFMDNSVQPVGWEFTRQIQSFTPYVQQQFVAPITIAGPGTAQAGNAVTFQVVAPHAKQTIYLEATAGVLNRQRLSGSGSVRLDTTGLDSGETIKLKAGYRYWPGDAEKQIKLT